jgi:glycosyltransferase involved in cell wall biosynthesis
MSSEFGGLIPMVTVIVPAYNVERYIESCVASILCQTFKNIEIIVINDGSTDNTAAILDRIAQREHRVKIIHTENNGVSAARNNGIRLAEGEYLIFVDGDDYLSQDFVEYMINLVRETQADFCLSTRCYTRKAEKQVKTDVIERYDSDEAIALLLSPEVVVGCWNKIYKKSMLLSNDLWFSESLFYGEGLTFITSVAKACEYVGVGNRKVYFYRKNNEASATTRFDIGKLYNGESALIEIGSSLGRKAPAVDLMYTYHLCNYRLGALVQLKARGMVDDYVNDYRRWMSYIRSHTMRFLFSNKLSLYRKLLMIVGCISPSVLAKMDTVRRRRIYANSVDG